MYNVQNLEARLTRWLHGTTLDQVTNPYDLIYESGEMVLLDIDPQETKVTTQIPLFNSVYDYPCPTDLKGNAEIDISPQVKIRSKRFVKKQQMRWTPKGVHLLLQVRILVLNEELESNG